MRKFIGVIYDKCLVPKMLGKVYNLEIRFGILYALSRKIGREVPGNGDGILVWTEKIWIKQKREDLKSSKTQ